MAHLPWETWSTAWLSSWSKRVSMCLVWTCSCFFMPIVIPLPIAEKNLASSCQWHSIGTDRLLWDAISSDFPEVTLCCPTLPKIVLFFLLDLHNLFGVVFSLLEFIPAALRKIVHFITNPFLNYFRQSVDDSSSYFWVSHLFHTSLLPIFLISIGIER